MNNIKQTGYTLIELLLYVSILGSLLIAVSLYFATTADARVKNQSVTEVNQQGTLAMELILQTIRNANSITSPTAGNSATSTVLVVPTGALSPTTFNFTSNTITIQEGAGGSVYPLTNSKVLLSSVTFQNLSHTGSPGLIQVSFTASRYNPSNKNAYSYSRTFTSTAALRWP